MCLDCTSKLLDETDDFSPKTSHKWTVAQSRWIDYLIENTVREETEDLF